MKAIYLYSDQEQEALQQINENMRKKLSSQDMLNFLTSLKSDLGESADHLEGQIPDVFIEKLGHMPSAEELIFACNNLSVPKFGGTCSLNGRFFFVTIYTR